MKRAFYMLTAGMLGCLVLLGACEKIVFPPPGDVPDNISYSADIQPIFDSKCVDCHAGSRDPDLRPAQSYNALIGGGYVNTGDPSSSELMQRLYGDHAAKATEKHKQYILGWITQGAKNN